MALTIQNPGRPDFDNRITALARDFQIGQQRAQALIAAWMDAAQTIPEGESLSSLNYTAEDITAIGAMLQMLGQVEGILLSLSADTVNTNLAVLQKIAPFTMPN